MSEECVAEADILMRAFNQPGHVANCQAREVRIFDNTDLRVKRGEWVRSNLWASFGDRRQQRGFSSVGKSHQPDLRHDSEFQQEIPFSSRFSGLGESRGL